MDIWTTQSLTVIGNFLGKTPLIDDRCFNSNVKFVARLLVEIDVSLHLYDLMDFVLNGQTYSQIINYHNIPFRYTRCHSYGHVGKDYDNILFKNVWKKKDILPKYFGREGKPMDPIQREYFEEQGLEVHGLVNILKGNFLEIGEKVELNL